MTDAEAAHHLRNFLEEAHKLWGGFVAPLDEAFTHALTRLEAPPTLRPLALAKLLEAAYQIALEAAYQIAREDYEEKRSD